MAEKHYYEVFNSNGTIQWKVYHYDETGNKEIVIARSGPAYYRTKDEALDAAADWCEENNIDAEMV